MRKILFFDDFLINRQRNLVRRWYRPEWLSNRLFIDDTTLFGGGYSSVVPAPSGGYYLYYVSFLAGGDNPDNSAVLCLAESDDGLTWRKAAFDPPRKSGHPQVVYPGDPVPAGCCVYHDPDDRDPSRRYKMTECVQLSPNSCRMLYSADGINWRVDREHPFLDRHSDTYLSLLHNPRTGRYQITLRRHCGDRRVFLIESENLETWSEPRLILHPDPLDAPMTQFYGMPQFRYADQLIGMLWRYQTTYDDKGPWKMAGAVETELAYSYDGLVWNRTHNIFMPLLERGEYGGGSMYGTAMIEQDDSLLVYAIASLEEHHHALGRKPGDPPLNGLLPGRLRKDGFVSLATVAAMGELTTDGLYLRGPELTLNVKAPCGGIKIQVCDMELNPLPGYRFDECAEIKGDSTACAPHWRNHHDLQGALDVLKRSCARIQIRMDQAELFSINGDFGVVPQSGLPGKDYL